MFTDQHHCVAIRNRPDQLGGAYDMECSCGHRTPRALRMVTAVSLFAAHCIEQSFVRATEIINVDPDRDVAGDRGVLRVARRIHNAVTRPRGAAPSPAPAPTGRHYPANLRDTA